MQLSFGTALCALLLFFAVATKLAGYYPHDPSAEPIAAAKVWQDTGTSSLPVEMEQAKPSPVVLDLIAAILSLVFAVAWYFSTEQQPGSALPSWFSPFLSVRPPPAT